MKYFSLIIALIFLSTFYSRGQYFPDSIEIVKSYQEKIENGKVIKYFGIGLIVAGSLTTIISTFTAFENLSANPTSATNLILIGLATTVIAIPIAIIGRNIQKSNKRKLEIYYRLGLRTMSKTPNIGLKYRF